MLEKLIKQREKIEAQINETQNKLVELKAKYKEVNLQIKIEGKKTK